MAQKKDEVYSGTNGMLYVRTDSGGIALTDAVKKLYGGQLGSVGTQYAAALGSEGDLTPSGLIEQYSSALRSAAQANAVAGLERIGAAAEASNAEYDTAARSLYAQKAGTERAMANRLASSGLYNSGYSDSARIALENQYAQSLAQSEAARHAAQDNYRLEGLELMAELGAENAKTDAEAAKLALGQLNTDREQALAQQKFEADRADADRDYALLWQKYQDSRADADREFALAQQKQEAQAAAERWERIQAEQAYRDSRADIEWERNAQLAAAKDKQAREKLDDAYAAAEMGDFSALEALGVDTTNAKAAYQAELELLMLKLAEAKSEAQVSGGGGSSVGGGSSSSGTKKSTGSSSTSSKTQSAKTTVGAYEKELAADLATRLVANMQEQNKTYTQVLEYVNSIRPGIVKQFGEGFWEEYVSAVSQRYPGGSNYEEPKHYSNISRVVDFINEQRNLTRFFNPDGYDRAEIKNFVDQADLSESERRELYAYYGLG